MPVPHHSHREELLPNILSNYALVLWKPFPLVLALLFKKFLSSSPEGSLQVLQPQAKDFSVNY